MPGKWKSVAIVAGQKDRDRGFGLSMIVTGPARYRKATADC
jgi:hypothetical protein